MTVMTWFPRVGPQLAFVRPNYIVRDFTGFGGAPVDIRLLRAPYQHGSTLVDSRMASRDLRLDVWGTASTVQQMWERRREISRALNPQLGVGHLQVARPGLPTVQIAAMSDEAPVFASPRSPQAWQASISLLAPHPLWRETTEQSEALPRGVTVPIDNTGDVPAPVEIIFDGPADHPAVWNMETLEHLRIDRMVEQDERFIIRTGFGAPSVVRISPSGGESDGMHFLAIHSRFWRLDLGETGVHYETGPEATEGTAELRHFVWLAGI